MRRLTAWVAGGLVLAGAMFGTFTVVEAGMASAAPSLACVQAQQRLAQARVGLQLIEGLATFLSIGGPSTRGEISYLIREATEQVYVAQEAVYDACTTSVTTSSTKSITSTSTITVTVTSVATPT